MYLLKGLGGTIILWIYLFYSSFGGFNNFKKILAENAKQLSESESLRNQVESFVNNPMFIGIIVGIVIISFIIGYFVMSIIQIIIDLVRRKAFQGFSA